MNIPSVKNIALLCVAIIISANTYAQPQGFNYQAVARDNNQHVLANQEITLQVSLLDDAEDVLWQEQHTVSTNDFGLFSIVIFNSDEDKTGGSAPSLSSIDWGASSHSLDVFVKDNGTFVKMGRHPLMAVPYALFAMSAGGWGTDNGNVIYMNGNVGVGTQTPAGRLTVTGAGDQESDPLFMVTRKDGYPVFAVYEHGVYAFTDTASTTKGIKGGFAVGGYTSDTKGLGTEYMRVTADSIRFYIDNSSEKGIKGGFAVGGYTDNAKGKNDFFHISGQPAAEILTASQPRILWYPRKEAFLAGRVLVLSPDSVGTNSFSTGYESKAKGNWSQAFGYRSVATGEYSTAIGKSAIARGSSSFAFGGNARALNLESFAFGRESWASGPGSFALGYDSYASGGGSYAIGSGTRATGLGSFAMGFVGKDSSNLDTKNTTASANYAVAIGMGAQALDRGAFSIGTETTADGPFSYAIGYRTTSSGWYSLSTGYNTNAIGNFSTAMGFGSSSTGSHSVAIGQGANANDWYAIAMGLKTVANGQQSIALGAESSALGDFSMAIGKSSTALSNGSIAIGFLCQADQNAMAVGYENTATGTYSTALGYRVNSTGPYSFAAGRNVRAEGDGSSALGSYVVSSGSSSFAFGQSTVADGAGSIAGGIQSIAAGNYSFACGFATEASGDWSFAAGQNTRATHWNTVAMGAGAEAKGAVAASIGRGTIAKPFASFAVGQYNDSSCSETGQTNWQSEDPLFIVGNGTGPNARKNAMMVRKDGEVYFPDAYNDQVGTPNRPLYIDDSGKIGYLVSSRRYKNNIRGMIDADWIYRLRPVFFTYKSDQTDALQYGLIAEEVEKVNPLLVSYNDSGEPETVSYSKLITPLIKTVQQQKELLDDKDRQIRELSERLQAVEEMLGMGNTR
jgi:hypothetical protein